MCEVLIWSIDAIRWPETISALAAVATAAIAFFALQTWRHQDKAKGKAEFLDTLIESAHTYIAEMSKPVTLFELAKIGMTSHAPTWESGEQSDIEIKGAIAFIQSNGEYDGKLLLGALEAVQPSVIKLRSLAAKGQVFKFNGYAKCQDAVAMLTWQFDRIEASMAVIGSTTSNFDHPVVLKSLKSVMAINPDDIRKQFRDSNIALLEFASEAYKKIYG